uniref:Uncharacterized protein n=1 Tax=Siphoviridae sp. ctXZx16 TaxID=2826371 RepID=A0A8S5MLS3_9CAUD|nr:MAG TPA: hypothetical protein [Siphoviridae sp. ctXZx16]
MRQIDRLRNMSLEEIAPLLVSMTRVDLDGFKFSIPNGETFIRKEDAINACITWLDSEYERVNI